MMTVVAVAQLHPPFIHTGLMVVHPGVSAPLHPWEAGLTVPSCFDWHTSVLSLLPQLKCKMCLTGTTWPHFLVILQSDCVSWSLFVLQSANWMRIDFRVRKPPCHLPCYSKTKWINISAFLEKTVSYFIGFSGLLSIHPDKVASAF